MFDRWTTAARRVIFVARWEAGAAGAEAIDTEHLLLGLLTVDPELVRGVGARLTTESARDLQSRWEAGGPALPTTADMPVSEEVGRIFAWSGVVVPAGGRSFFRTEHLLLGLAESSGGHAAELLAEAGARMEEVRRRAMEANSLEQQEGRLS